MTNKIAPDVTPGLTADGYRRVAAYKRRCVSDLPPGSYLRDRKEAEAAAYEAAAVRVCEHEWGWVVGAPGWNGAQQQCKHCDMPKPVEGA